MRNLPPISLIGAPTDIGGGHRGASMGPEALRVAGIGARPAARAACRWPTAATWLGPVNPMQPPVDGYRHLAEVVAWNGRCATRWPPNSPPAACRSCSAATIASAIGSITAVAQ